jgi:hypothetical protein
MGEQFVRLREHHPKKAWTFYRDALMFYAADLRDLISPETIIERAMRIETFVNELREVAEKHELTPAEALDGMRSMLRQKTAKAGRHGRPASFRLSRDSDPEPESVKPPLP